MPPAFVLHVSTHTPGGGEGGEGGEGGGGDGGGEGGGGGGEGGRTKVASLSTVEETTLVSVMELGSPSACSSSLRPLVERARRRRRRAPLEEGGGGDGGPAARSLRTWKARSRFAFPEGSESR